MSHNVLLPFKSPDLDGVFQALLQHSFDLLSRRLKMIYEASLKLGHIPKVWTFVNFVFIPQQGKSDYTSPKSFRPISLASFLLKTLERLADRFVRNATHTWSANLCISVNTLIVNEDQQRLPCTSLFTILKAT